ncbi:hypothetical protein SAMN05421778_101270 [Sphaerotilus natans]|jgi:2-polyprenyl-6-methoxyphenol hydroxylase-like FAD-dependent oxidoreductase|uniref:hypothetical protein n=1 Tax=Sphaerotilus natans TaxID=34103 RepID=UPI0009567547|nr:hypothetical protein [Sphaerotilus natans]SIQ06488.1 hypothetical protein SAMN05421778_101270 [Sphaerotilus natans]
MTGNGFSAGVDDAAALAGLLAAQPHPSSVPAVLDRYQSVRLPDIHTLVGHSMRLSTEFVRYAAGIRSVR